MKIVLTSESFAPAELLRDCLTVGAALEQRGHLVSYIASDPVALVENAGGKEPRELYQAPTLRPEPNLVYKTPPVGGFEDVIALSGFRDRRQLMTMASIWHRMFAQSRPDVILGFCSPVAWLVGPVHCATFAAGNSQFMPPILGSSFPRLSARSAPIMAEHAQVANANAVLAKLGGSALMNLADLLHRCERLHYGLSYFDPYLSLRSEPSLGFLGDRPKGPVPAPTEPKVAAFLDARCPNVEALILALWSQHGAKVDVWINGATTAMKNFLAQNTAVTLFSDFKAVLAGLAQASVVVHHGEQDISQQCAVLGRSQLVVPWTPEQNTLDAATRWMGMHWEKSDQTSLAELAPTLEMLLKDRSTVVQAQFHAQNLSQLDIPAALPRIVKAVEAHQQSGALRVASAGI